MNQPNDALDDILQEAIEAGVPAVALCATDLEGRSLERYAGADPEGAPVTAESYFDLASVTKAACTSSVAAVLMARGLLDLDMPASRVLRCASDASARELLSHASGLTAWEPLFMQAASDLFGNVNPRPREFRRPRERMRRAILATEVSGVRGQRVYSDLGFMLLGLLLEELGRDPLDRLFADLVAAPLGLEELLFFDLIDGQQPTQQHVLPTGTTRPREPAPGQEQLLHVPAQSARLVPGEVDDDNAWAFGGVAGHAGLFGTARCLAQLGRGLMKESRGADVLGASEQMQRWFRPARRGERCLGWDTPEGEDSLAGRVLGRGARGGVMHLGFTGTSLVLDLDRGLSVALLTNRTLPGRAQLDGIRALRPSVHDAVTEHFSAVAR
ncbi:MAG: beta-lactamase family protein [Deltaproteobacteria bacterium]|nr:beta-lactamase family protein [Deltaproteobacteria bacterium]